jgi:hypothetical protein
MFDRRGGFVATLRLLASFCGRGGRQQSRRRRGLSRVLWRGRKPRRTMPAMGKVKPMGAIERTA